MVYSDWLLLASFFQAGARHSFGVMFKPMIAQLGWNRASISLAFFVIKGDPQDFKLKPFGHQEQLKVKTDQDQNQFTFYIFALTFGFTFLITAPLTATLVGRLYGFAHVGLLSGFVTTVHHFGGGFWAYMGGLIFDKTVSYRLIFILSAILATAALGCRIFIKEKRHEMPLT